MTPPEFDVITFACPSCGHEMSSDESTVGQVGKCKKCGADVVVPPSPLLQRIYHGRRMGRVLRASGQLTILAGGGLGIVGVPFLSIGSIPLGLTVAVAVGTTLVAIGLGTLMLAASSMLDMQVTQLEFHLDDE